MYRVKQTRFKWLNYRTGEFAIFTLVSHLTSQSLKCKESIQLTCLITHFLTNDGNQFNCILLCSLVYKYTLSEQNTVVITEKIIGVSIVTV